MVALRLFGLENRNRQCRNHRGSPTPIAAEAIREWIEDHSRARFSTPAHPRLHSWYHL